MRRRCEPLFDGDTGPFCGAWFDDLYRLAVCPHVLLEGGDSVGIAPCVPVACPEPQEIEVTLVSIGYADVCWDTDDDGECPKCVAGLGASPVPYHRFALCPKRGVFG